jgi:hypothetical protein
MFPCWNIWRGCKLGISRPKQIGNRPLAAIRNCRRSVSMSQMLMLSMLLHLFRLFRRVQLAKIALGKYGGCYRVRTCGTPYNEKLNS